MCVTLIMALSGIVGCNDASKENTGNKNPNIEDGDNYAPDIFDDWEWLETKRQKMKDEAGGMGLPFSFFQKETRKKEKEFAVW